MPPSKPRSPAIPDAIGALNTQIPSPSPDLASASIRNAAAEGMASALQQAQAATVAASAVNHLTQLYSVDPTDPQDPLSGLSTASRR